MKVLVRSDPDEEENRVIVAVAGLRLQTNIGESFAELLKLGDGLGLVCRWVNYYSDTKSRVDIYLSSQSDSLSRSRRPGWTAAPVIWS